MAGETKALDNTTRNTIEEIKNTWSAQGKRVILLARKTVPKAQLKSLPTSGQFEDEVAQHARTGLTLVGIVGIVDPPRDEIPVVVKTLRRAGIRIFMVCIQVVPLEFDANSLTGHWRFRTHCPSHRYRMWYCHQPSSSS